MERRLYAVGVPREPKGGRTAFEIICHSGHGVRLDLDEQLDEYRFNATEPELIAVVDAAFSVFGNVHILDVLDVVARTKVLHQRTFRARQTGDDR